jgi:hypothetical protein
MLMQVAEGVLVHQSELLQNNTVAMQGRAGVLIIDPGITGSEMACLANDLREQGQAGRLLDASALGCPLRSPPTRSLVAPMSERTRDEVHALTV